MEENLTKMLLYFRKKMLKLSRTFLRSTRLSERGCMSVWNEKMSFYDKNINGMR